MKLADLKNILDATGYPVSYRYADKGTSLPFICYLYMYSGDFFAESKNYLPIQNIQVELYSNKKDMTAERNIESIFDKQDFGYTKTETYIETEKMVQIIYEIQLIGD